MNIVVVEDDANTRRRIVNQLSQSLSAPHVVEVGTCAQARELAQTLTIDCWLIDLGLPDGHGTDLIAHVRALQPQANVLVITVFGDANSIVRSIEAGANGYLLKDALDHDLSRAVEAVNSGGTPLSPLVASLLLERFVRPFADVGETHPPSRRGITKPAPTTPMTQREVELLNLFARGYTYQEAAELMDVGVSTIQSHVRNIYSKLLVSSKSEAVFEAKAMGLLN